MPWRRYAQHMVILVLLLVIAFLVWKMRQDGRAAQNRMADAVQTEQQLRQELGRVQASGSASGGQLKEAQAYSERSYERIVQLEKEIRELTQKQASELVQRSSRAVAASRGSYDGHVAEQAFPASPQHPYHPRDIFHFGGVVDYIVFDGLHAVRHEGRDPQTVSVVLVDVKWGSSRSTDAQQAVLSAVASGRVRAESWHARGGPDDALSYGRREITGN